MEIDDSLVELILRTSEFLNIDTPPIEKFTIDYAWKKLLWPVFYSASAPINDEEVFWLLKELDDLKSFEYPRIRSLYKDYEIFDKLDKIIFDSIMDIHLKYRNQEAFPKENEILKKFTKIPIRNNIISSLMSALNFFVEYMEESIEDIYDILLTNPERIVIAISTETQYEAHKTSKIFGFGFSLSWLWLHEMGFALDFTTASLNSLLLLDECLAEQKISPMYDEVQRDFEKYLTVNAHVNEIVGYISNNHNRPVKAIHFDYTGYFFNKTKKRLLKIDETVANRYTPLKLLAFLDENSVSIEELDVHLKDLYKCDDIINWIYRFIKS